MAQAAYAYQSSARRTHRQERETFAQPDLRVLPGKGSDRARQAALSPQLQALFGVLLFAVLFLSAICGVRVAFANATLQMLIETQSINQATIEARAYGTELEVAYSLATNPEHIQELAAEQLGMTPDEQVEYLRPLAGE
ncbi:MAG: hypothetical protein LBO07_01645 [Coriobacteriales bacterium]|jgi:hypothetical protein|nr:hypothetical protein [Coriobacteriales bacterium]